MICLMLKYSEIHIHKELSSLSYTDRQYSGHIVFLAAVTKFLVDAALAKEVF